MAGGLSLYTEGESLLHRAHPLTKGMLTLSAVALAFIAPSATWVLVVLAVLIVLVIVAGVLKRMLAVALAILLPIALLLAVVQSFANTANHTVLFAIGGPFIFYKEGVAIAALASLRIACLVAATFLFSFTTRPTDITEALMQRGLSPRMGYVLQSALQVIPQTLDMATRIQDAQRSRGLETEGSIRRRASAYLPLMLPLVLSSLVATQERAMALEVRGFGLPVKRQSRYEFVDSSTQVVLRWLLGLAPVAAVVARIAGWQ